MGFGGLGFGVWGLGFGVGTRRGTVEGVQGVRLYTLVYLVITRVMWQSRTAIKVMRRSFSNRENQVRKVRELKYRTDRYQLGKENPVLGVRRARTGISMAGVPPIAGFGAKRGVFRALIDSSYYRLATRGVRRSVIGAYNYVRIVKRIFFEENRSNAKEEEVVVIRNKERSRKKRKRRKKKNRIEKTSISSIIVNTSNSIRSSKLKKRSREVEK